MNTTKLIEHWNMEGAVPNAGKRSAPDGEGVAASEQAGSDSASPESRAESRPLLVKGSEEDAEWQPLDPGAA